MEKVVIGNAELWHGDCGIILQSLPFFDLMLSDPPYGINEAAGKNKSRGTKNAPGTDFGNDDWDKKPPPAWLIELIREKAKWQIIFGGNYFHLPPSSCWLVWDKDNTGDFADCELAWTNLPKAVRMLKWRWNGMLQQDMKNKEIREHPTQKPIQVMRWALLHAADNQTVCDPFMGSGTTGIACALEGKAFTGIEKERKYFDIACERIARAHAQGQLFEPEAPTPPAQQVILLA